MSARYYVRGLTRREEKRLARMTPEERRRAVVDALAGAEIDDETRERLARSWKVRTK